MKRLLIGTIGALLAFSAQAKLNVVVTTPDLASIAQQVGGDKIELTTLARPTEDPHFVDAKPSFIVKLNKANALIEGGAELEIGWLPSLMAGARNSKLSPGAPGLILCSEGIRMLEVPEKLDRSKGDLHAMGNPHFAIDPVNAKIIATHIANALGRIDRANSGTYAANAKAFNSLLDKKLAEWEAKMAPVKGAQVVAYHNSWRYFADRYGLKIELFLEPKPGIPPSPAHLADVISKMKSSGARVVIVDPYLNRKIADTVAAQTGATVVDVTQFPGGVKGTEGGYVALQDYLVNSLAKALAEKK